jgi:hypothetical protein
LQQLKRNKEKLHLAESAVRSLSNSLSPNRLVKGVDQGMNGEESKNDYGLENDLDEENFDYYNSEKDESQLKSPDET